jgi:hypothetical protein
MPYLPKVLKATKTFELHTGLVLDVLKSMTRRSSEESRMECCRAIEDLMQTYGPHFYSNLYEPFYAEFIDYECKQAESEVKVLLS